MKERIHEIATEHCAEYPDIKNCAPYEQLYAIESVLIGTKQANEDCHAFIQHLIKLAGMTTDEAVKSWESILQEQKKAS